MSDQKSGGPIRELEGLQQSPSPGFADRIRNAIERRRLASELTDFTWQGLRLLLLEYIELPIRLLRPREPTDGGDP